MPIECLYAARATTSTNLTSATIIDPRELYSIPTAQSVVVSTTGTTSVLHRSTVINGEAVPSVQGIRRHHKYVEGGWLHRDSLLRRTLWRKEKW